MSNNLSNLIFYTKYSRLINGKQETYIDMVNRVMNGIKKYSKFKTDEKFFKDMTRSLYEKKWCPAGRVLYNMGTSQVDKSSIYLNNCAFISTEENFSDAMQLSTLLLMSGVGVGYDLKAKHKFKNLMDYNPNELFKVQDNKESWSESIKKVIDNPRIKFDYTKIRPKGSILKSSGGTSAGPEELKNLHDDIRKYIFDRMSNKISDLRCTADIINRAPLMILSSAGRRSAQLLTTDGYNEEFLDLKLNNDRKDICYFSNNSITLNEKKDFTDIGKILKNVSKNGEPGLINCINLKKYGRYSEICRDTCISVNPCGEANLSDGELCNLASTAPINCENMEDWRNACTYAAYCSLVVSTIPTNIKKIDEVIKRNHRIGISINGYPELSEKYNRSDIIYNFDKCYGMLKQFCNTKMREIHENPPIKLTCEKPEGSLSLLMKCCAGLHYPLSQYYIRRVMFSNDDPVCKILKKSGIPHEKHEICPNNTLFLFKVHNNCKKTIKDINLYDQLLDMMMMQRFWCDQSVSYTAYFKKEEEEKLVDIVTAFIPYLKSLSLMPYTENHYSQQPITPITKSEYDSIIEKKIDWSKYKKDSVDSKYCTNDTCGI